MKDYIDEMIQNIDNEYTEELNEEDFQIDDLEVKRICAQVKKKQYSKGRKKLKWHKKILLVAAIIICLVSAMTVFSEMRESIIDFLFTSNEKSLGKSGVLIEKSDEHQNLKVTIKGMIGYDKVISIIYDVEKTDGVAFKGNRLDFYSYIEVEDGNQKARYMIKDNREIYSEHTDLKREYVATISNYFDNMDSIEDEKGNRADIKGINVESFRGKKMKFVIEEIAQQYYGKKLSDFDLAEYVNKQGQVKTHPSWQDPMVLYNFGSRHEAYKNINMLENKHLGITPYKEFPKVTIEGIGFVDKRLHLITSHTTNPSEENALPYVDSPVVRWNDGFLMLGNIRVHPYRRKGNNGSKRWMPEGYCLRIADKSGKDITCPILASYADFIYEHTKNEEKYEVYNIKNVEELRQYKLMAILKYNEAVTQADWKIPFQVELKDNPVDIHYNGRIRGDSDGNWVVDKISLANVYLHIQLRHTNKMAKEPMMPTPIKLIMKDKTEVTLVQSAKIGCDLLNPYEGLDKEDHQLKECYVYENSSGPNANIDAFFLKAKDINQIGSIQIGDVKIPVK